MIALLAPIFFIAVGGASGAVTRYLAATSVTRYTGGEFPFGILLVNVIGSFLMGIALIFLLHRSGDSRMGPLLMTGFLGGFTTFSTFSLDTVLLIEKGRIAAAAAYVGGSVGLSVAGLMLGMTLAKGITA